MQLSVVNAPDRDLVWTNCAFVNTRVFVDLVGSLTPDVSVAKTQDTDAEDLVLKLGTHDKVETHQIALNSVQRKFLNVRVGEQVVVDSVAADDMDEDSAPVFAVNTRSVSSQLVRLEKEHFSSHVLSNLSGHYVRSGQEILVQYVDSVIILKVCSGSGWINGKELNMFAGRNVKLHTQANVSKLRIRELGIGGLDAEFEELVRRAFASRSMPRHMIEKLGVKHVKGVLLHGHAGGGKCLGLDTPVMMFDGSFKMVQDICVGERIMGDDSTPRTILSLARGREEMFKIAPTKGEGYVVNKSHVLCLKYSRTDVSFRQARGTWRCTYADAKGCHEKYFKTEEAARVYSLEIGAGGVVEISVKDFLELPSTTQRAFKAFRTPVVFPFMEVPLDPYMLGLWLGDGCRYHPLITNVDPEIIAAINAFAQENKLDVTKRGINYTLRRSSGVAVNSFTKALITLELIKNKHVPSVYKHNCREVQLQLLAGFLDADGHLKDTNVYDVVQKSKALLQDFQYICRSLGFQAHMVACSKHCMYKGVRRVGTYYRMHISGAKLHEIPCKVARKQANINKPNKDGLRYGFQIEPLGVGDYYGFEIDGNRRFVLGDFSVTHNTLLARKLGEVLGCRRPKLVNGPEILNKFVGESERNIRELFKEAEEAQSNNDPDIHVIIFDEIDAICKARGSGGSQAGVNDSIVNQLLTKMDGVDALDNILVIGLTNRKDMLDPALLRPGRLEVHVEIAYPDAQGRREIFDIHTSTMKRNGYLSDDVDVAQVVARTKHHTGAEIEGVVKSATSYALARVQERPEQALSVTMADIYLALNDTKPAFTSSALRDDVSELALSKTQCDELERVVHPLKHHQTGRHRVLVTAEHGEDASLTANFIAHRLGYETVKIVRPLDLVCLSEMVLAQNIKTTFFELDRCSEAIIILEDVEALAQYCSLGPTYSNIVWQTLKCLFQRKPVKDNKLAIIGTCNSADFTARFDLQKYFDAGIQALQIA